MDKFRIWIKFTGSNESHLDTDWCEQEELSESLRRLFHGPAAQMGIIAEVKVINTMDCTVFLVQNGKQVWPAAA